MNIQEVLRSPARLPVMTVCLLLLLLQMALFLAAFRDGRSRKTYFLYILQFLVGLAFFYFSMLEITWVVNFPDGSGKRPAALALFCNFPVSVLFTYEIFALIAVLASIWETTRYRRRHLTNASIKETLDLLPAGVAFGRADGTVVFSNLSMNRLFRKLTGRRITDLRDLQEEIFNRKIKDTLAGKESGEKEIATDKDWSSDGTGEATETAFSVRQGEASTCPHSLTQVALPDGSGIWQVAAENLDVEGESFVEIVATDITEQAAFARELEEKNERLRDMHRRLDLYNRQADRIIIAQELLTARMAVHNEVGNVLLESRHYLKEPASFDEEKLLQALKNTNTYLLREYEEDDTVRDALADALEMAEAIGVDVDITGVIPEGDPARKILAAAIGECASNTVKHAGGDRLRVEIYNDGGFVYILSSNGKQPEGEIRETGGLLSLRLLVENEGGAMQETILPEFTLRISLPAQTDTHLT